MAGRIEDKDMQKENLHKMNRRKIDKISHQLMNIKGVAAVGVAYLDDGIVLYAYLEYKKTQKLIPNEINGVKIISKYVGKIKPAKNFDIVKEIRKFNQRNT